MAGPTAQQGSRPAGATRRIAVLFHRLGPYHHARLRAAARQAEVTAVEFSEVDRTYAWDKVERSTAFEHVTLFRDKDIDEQSSAAIIRRMAAALGRIRPDVVAIPGWSSRGALAALGWCAVTRTPAIVMSASTERDEVRTPWREAVKAQILRLCSAALAGGKAQSDYLALLGMRPDRIFVGYDVIDNDHFASGADAARQDAAALRTRLGLPPRYFVASSRFVPKKNLPRLIQAFADYRQRAGSQAWSLVLLGDGPGAAQVNADLAAAGLTDAVLLPGFKQYDELPVYYGLAEAFVHVSTSEQWGLVVNEAMAAGLPVLVSRHCGCVPDLVEDGRNGYALDPEDVRGLTDLLLRMASPTCDRAAMGAASRDIIRRWSPATFAQGLGLATETALALRKTPLRASGRVGLRG